MKMETGIFTKFRLMVKIGAMALCASLMYSMIDVQPVMGNPETGKPTVEMVLRDTTLGTALKLIAENNGYGFESQAALEERVNLDMSGLGFEDTVHRLLAGKPYNWTAENKVLKVYPATALAEPVQEVSVNEIQTIPAMPVVEPDEQHILVLKNRRPDEMVGLLTPLVKDVKLMADVRTNSILMSGSKDAIKATIAMATDLDGIQTVQGMEDKREYLSEVFSLDYISDFADLEQNLNFILYGSSQPQNNQALTQQQNNTAPGGQIIEQPTVPVRKEYYLLDKIRRLLMITAAATKWNYP
jgi:type II secretory pathway component GspD/PulD (secretin)